MTRIRKDNVAAAGVGAFVPTAVALFMLFGVRGCPLPVPGPGPAPDVKPTGTHVVVMVDDSAPSIPLGLVIDDNQTRALSLAGKWTVASISKRVTLRAGDVVTSETIPDPYFTEKGFDQLLTPAGGAPAMAILRADGSAAHVGRYPTDRAARDALLKKHVIGLPPPLPEAPKAYVQSLGFRYLVNPQGDGTDWFTDDTGVSRRLTAKSDPVRFKALPKYATSNPTFPEREWRDLDRRNIFGSDDWCFNQGNHGSCVGNGWTAALRKARVLAGMKDVKLSPEFCYAWINGGRDQGAVISDGIEALKTHGVCPFSMNPQGPPVKIYSHQLTQEMKAAALDYKLHDAYRCDTWEETVSALLTGRYIVVLGIQVGNTWGHFDKYGVCGHDRGPGNHCVHCDGLHKLSDGRWVLDMENSWGYDWGAFKNGRAYLDKDHLFGRYGDQPDVCVVRIAARSSKEPFDPPAYKPGKSVNDTQIAIAP